MMICLIELIEGGNRGVQQSIKEFFTQEQSKTQRFFQICADMLIESSHLEQEEPYISKIEKVLDSITLVHRHRDKYFGTQCILHYLQLLCENHNNDLQNYLRDQFLSQQKYNMLTIVTQLLSNYIFDKGTHFSDQKKRGL